MNLADCHDELGILLESSGFDKEAREFKPKGDLMKNLAIILAVGLYSLGAAAAASGDGCIMKASIEGFSSATDSSVVVDAGPSTSYLVTTMGDCDGLSFAENIGFRTWPEDSMEVCTGDSIVFGGDIGPTDCAIQTIAPTGSN
jgi:Family of unknown function (DUF6491)